MRNLLVAAIAVTLLAIAGGSTPSQAAESDQRVRPITCSSLAFTGPDVVAREYVTGRVLLVCTGRVRIELETCIQVRLVVFWRNVVCMPPRVRRASSLEQTARGPCRRRGARRTMRVWAVATISRAGQSSSDPGWSSPKRVLC